MKALLDELHVPHAMNVPLGPLTWYGVGGAAEVLARPSSLQQLSQLCARAKAENIPIHVLGEGANLLVADDGVSGIVIKLDSPAFLAVRYEGNRVFAGAGADLRKLVVETARRGLAGLDCLAGIPATVGGAIRMNAGGTFGSIGQCIRRIQVMDAAGQVYYRDRDDLVFGYRTTNIVARFILEAEFELQVDDPEEIRKRVKKVYFLKKNSQPLEGRSAGCAFKNLESLPEGVDPSTPLSAGKLIDMAGLKGFAIGGASVSNQHANFIVAEEGAKAADVLAVIEHIESEVARRFGVNLEREVEVWPRHGGKARTDGGESV
ncbi:MAG: UDP-N-acetylmuramate dehydrogenase [Phycisphaeraceae bacterium]|nr:UDP-N-acetylmuramate dehydrogenase [Phycisphaeraceae bacterium]